MDVPTPVQLEATVTAMCLVGASTIAELLARGAARARAIHELPDDGSRDDAITLLAAELDSSEMRRAAYAMAAAVAGQEQATTLDMLAVACAE